MHTLCKAVAADLERGAAPNPGRTLKPSASDVEDAFFAPPVVRTKDLLHGKYCNQDMEVLVLSDAPEAMAEVYQQDGYGLHRTPAKLLIEESARSTLFNAKGVVKGLYLEGKLSDKHFRGKDFDFKLLCTRVHAMPKSPLADAATVYDEVWLTLGDTLQRMTMCPESPSGSSFGTTY